MAKSKAVAAAANSSGKKRSRDATEDKPPKAAAVVKDESSASSSENDDSESDDDSDSETENTLFRPAPVTRNESDGSSSEEESSSSEDEEEEEEEEDTPVKEEAAPVKKPTDKKAKPAADVSDVNVESNIQEEMDKKTEATVYVEGIPYQADEGDVVSHFSVCGIVKEVRMPRYQDSGRPRGYAHVVFESEKAIPKALALDGKYLFKRYLSVSRAQTPRTLELALKETKNVKKAVVGCKTVFVKQLPYDIEEQALRDALASCGTIMSVRLPIWNHTKKLKGFGYVEFSKEEEAVAAVKRSGMKVGGRMVIINLDVAGAPKASFRQTDGQYWNKTEEAKKSLAKKLSEKQQRSGATNKKRKTTK
uniref:RRM domain-containing protein n=1 Tax=Globisporangium ultimum (strain ATCC 200006 / CBS 805.95 / DAOM BR144) TaxID=431595 RepID=K3WSU1_GLOUD